MTDIEELVARILGNRKLREGATFSTRTYGDQPILQTGRQLRERREREAQERKKDYRKHPQGKQTLRRQRDLNPSQERLDFDQSTGTLALPPQGRPPRGASRRGAQPDRRPNDVPERYWQLRELAQHNSQPASTSRGGYGALAYGSRGANRLFYEQARFMDDFEDEYDYHGSFVQYFPTYASMTIEQLRGYFSWRTKVRRGLVEDAPLSFAFVYVYELLCGVGCTPGADGFAKLAAFRETFGQRDAARGSTFEQYLSLWLHDYVIYHELDVSLLPSTRFDTLPEHVLVLLMAEEAQLKAQGLERKIESSITADASEPASAPSDEQLLDALDACSSYQLCGARLYKSNPDDLRFVACETFRGLVAHCSKRRKTDFVEGLFGTPYAVGYTMYAGAVFFESEPHADASYRVSPAESYVCRNGRWLRNEICDARSRSKELGSVMRAVDIRLRARIDYPYPLKERKTPVYVARIIDKAIDTLLERKEAEAKRLEEEERRRIHIDLSQLASIRAAAALTQEALLTEEEREETPTPPSGQLEPSARELREVGGADGPGTARESQGGRETQAEPEAKYEATTMSDAAESVETRVLKALLAGKTAASALEPGDPLLSLVVDQINENYFDLVGDTVLEYDGDEPTLVPDYEQDVREIVGA